MRFSVSSVSYSSTFVGKVLDERPHLILETFIQLVLRAADAEHVRGQARAAVVLEDLQNLFALAEAVQEGRDGAEVDRVRSQPEQVAGDPVQLRHDHADVLRAGRRGHAQQFLDGFAVAQAVGDRRDVVHAVERGHELAVGLRLAQLLDAAMEIADDAFRIQHAFAVELQLHLQHAVRRRVLRPHADC